MKTRLLPSLGLALVALIAQPASAQFLYKSTMPDGKVIYSDSPMPGAAKVEKSKPDTSNKGVAPPTAREAAVLKQMEAEREARDAPADRTRAMEEALRNAEAARDAGKEPREGERIGTAGGASRLTDAYFERQKGLEAAVEAARRNLEIARGGTPVGPPPSGFPTQGFPTQGFPTPQSK